MSQWYALRARNELRTRDDLADRGFCGYVPMERVNRRLGRKVRAVDRPVWRGYVFVPCEPEDAPRLLLIEGVHDFVRHPVEVAPGLVALLPVTLDLHLLDPILAAEWAGELDYAAKADFMPQLGDLVTVKSGKWKGFLGRIVALSKRKMTLEGEQTSIGKLQIEPEHLSQAPDEQHLAA